MSPSRLLIAGLAGALASVPAAAQNRESWGGGYVGGQIGVGTVDGDSPRVLFDTDLDGSFDDTVRTGAGADAFSPGFCDGRASGATPADGCRDGGREIEGGLHAGFDVDLGSLVVGVVGEYNRHRLEDSVAAFSTTPASYSLTRELRESYGIRARAGVPVLGSTLLYGTAGLVNGRFRHSFESTNTANAFAVDDRSTRAWGHQLGAGIEQRLGGFSVGLLYLYTSIKDDDGGQIAVTQGTAPATNPFIRDNPGGTQFLRSDERFRSHGLKATASLRF